MPAPVTFSLCCYYVHTDFAVCFWRHKTSSSATLVWSSDVQRGQNVDTNDEVKTSRPRSRSRPDTYRYFWIRTHGVNVNNTFVSHVRVLNDVFLMNVAMIQPRNGLDTTNIIFALDSTFWGQVNKNEARPSPNAQPRPRSRPKFWHLGQSGRDVLISTTGVKLEFLETLIQGVQLAHSSVVESQLKVVINALTVQLTIPLSL